MGMIDLNADLGESFGAYRIGDDAALLKIVSSANIACGFHGGDPGVMRDTVARAVAEGVALGAHPGFPDLQGFGRRRMTIPARDLEAMVIYQIGALDGFARAAGARLQHVKPHGALNTMAAEDAETARAVARAVRAVDPDLILLGPARSQLIAAAEAEGLRAAGEIFADRSYTEAGSLTPRAQPGALIEDPDRAAAQILAFLDAGGIVTPSGAVLPAPLHSVCVHGDSPHAAAMAAALRARLEQAGHAVRAMGALPV